MTLSETSRITKLQMLITNYYPLIEYFVTLEKIH